MAGSQEDPSPLRSDKRRTRRLCNLSRLNTDAQLDRPVELDTAQDDESYDQGIERKCTDRQ